MLVNYLPYALIHSNIARILYIPEKHFGRLLLLTRTRLLSRLSMMKR